MKLTGSDGCTLAMFSMCSFRRHLSYLLGPGCRGGSSGYVIDVPLLAASVHRLIAFGLSWENLPTNLHSFLLVFNFINAPIKLHTLTCHDLVAEQLASCRAMASWQMPNLCGIHSDWPFASMLPLKARFIFQFCQTITVLLVTNFGLLASLKYSNYAAQGSKGTLFYRLNENFNLFGQINFLI